MSSLIATHGFDKALEWARGFVKSCKKTSGE